MSLSTQLTSLYSVPSAVLDLQKVGKQHINLQGKKVSLQGERSPSSTIAGAVHQVAKLENGQIDTLNNICKRLQIPSTTGRLSRMIALMKSDSDYAAAYCSTSEDAMTDRNKTAAYNAAKMARSRLSKETENGPSQINCSALLSLEKVLVRIQELANEIPNHQAAYTIQKLADAVYFIPKMIIENKSGQLDQLLDKSLRTLDAVVEERP